MDIYVQLEDDFPTLQNGSQLLEKYWSQGYKTITLTQSGELREKNIQKIYEEIDSIGT